MTPSVRVLAALGLSGVVGCGEGCGEEAHPCLSMVDPDAGPCLEMPPEPPPPATDADDPGEARPTVCLNIAPEPPVAPCLEMVEPPPEPPPPEVGACLNVAPEPPRPCLSELPPEPPPEEPPPPVGPCLKVAPEPDTRGSSAEDRRRAQEDMLKLLGQPGPCLDIAEDPEPVEDTQPCLDFAPCLSKIAPEPPAEAPPAPPSDDQGALHGERPVDRVLARGVLPDDVAALLAGRRG